MVDSGRKWKSILVIFVGFIWKIYLPLTCLTKTVCRFLGTVQNQKTSTKKRKQILSLQIQGFFWKFKELKKNCYCALCSHWLVQYFVKISHLFTYQTVDKYMNRPRQGNELNVGNTFGNNSRHTQVDKLICNHRSCRMPPELLLVLPTLIHVQKMECIPYYYS